MGELTLSAGARGAKQREDALDALICAWVGACMVDHEALGCGDDDAAIWIPYRPQVFDWRPTVGG